MLIEEQMDLIKRMAGDLPVMFFVHITKGDGVGQELIQILHAFGADFFVQRDGQLGDFSVGLNFAGLLAQNRFGLVSALFQLLVRRSGFVILGIHGILSLLYDGARAASDSAVAVRHGFVVMIRAAVFPGAFAVRGLT